jgi:transposase InsO family protein
MLPLSQNYPPDVNLTSDNTYIALARDKRKLFWCLEQFRERKMAQKQLSEYLGIKPRRFRQLYSSYIQTFQVPNVGLNVGRPKKVIPEHWKQIIHEAYSRHRTNALTLEKIIFHEKKIRIPHNTIHKILLEQGHACEQVNKQKKRKPWIRYERDYSLSAVYMAWHTSKTTPGKSVCIVLDNASRKILAGGEFSNANAENSVLLLKDVVDQCRENYTLDIQECISNRGPQFYNKSRDKNIYTGHVFEDFLAAEGIKQILCGVNHPQTNSKVAKWFDFYEKHRSRYGSLAELIEWYNNRAHGSLNLRYAMSPDEAFIRKMPTEYWFWAAKKLF